MGLKIYKEVKGTKIDTKLLRAIYKSTLKYFNLKDIFSIEVTLVDEKTIQETNKETRGIDRVTDVLSFPTVNFSFPFNKEDYIDAINPEDGKIMLGDLMLCEAKAREQAQEFGHSFDREVGFLVLHGMLHLLGFDHIKKEDEVVMMGHAENILKELNLTRDV